MRVLELTSEFVERHLPGPDAVLPAAVHDPAGSLALHRAESPFAYIRTEVLQRVVGRPTTAEPAVFTVGPPVSPAVELAAPLNGIPPQIGPVSAPRSPDALAMSSRLVQVTFSRRLTRRGYNTADVDELVRRIVSTVMFHQGNSDGRWEINAQEINAASPRTSIGGYDQAEVKDYLRDAAYLIGLMEGSATYPPLPGTGSQ
jgi:DivIVA domain-containing protein